LAKYSLTATAGSVPEAMRVANYEPADLDHVVASEQIELRGLLDDRPMVSVPHLRRTRSSAGVTEAGP
jgi:hypothetical protein